MRFIGGAVCRFTAKPGGYRLERYVTGMMNDLSTKALKENIRHLGLYSYP